MDPGCPKISFNGAVCARRLRSRAGPVGPRMTKFSFGGTPTLPCGGAVAYRFQNLHFFGSKKTRNRGSWTNTRRRFPEGVFVRPAPDPVKEPASTRPNAFRPDDLGFFHPKVEVIQQLGVKHTSLLPSLRALRRSGARSRGVFQKSSFCDRRTTRRGGWS